LFDKAINDIEHSRYEIARLTLQTLLNTYDTSEYTAKAKLAIADSWYREGGARGLAQAEAEYKDFKLFYPAMEEAAEAQNRVCDIHYKQMETADRDPMHALRAQDECRTLLQEYPNSKFAPIAMQKMRDIQEVLGEGEFRVGTLYFKKASFPAAANRFRALTDQFPLYSRADEALWDMANSYHKMGDRFENQEAAAYGKLIREYPLSNYADDAKAKLQAMNRAVPEADPAAAARMKDALENRTRASLPGRVIGVFGQRPDVHSAAKSGTPTMAGLRPTVPASVPASAAGAESLSAEVSAAIVTDSTALDKNPDARLNPPGASAAAASTATPPQTVNPADVPLASNHVVIKKQKKSKKNAKTPQPQAAPAAAATPPAGDAKPASTQPQP
jgi:outer membrane protein assembly factor BamD